MDLPNIYAEEGLGIFDKIQEAQGEYKEPEGTVR